MTSSSFVITSLSLNAMRAGTEPALGPCRSTASWPKTKSWVMTRAESAASRRSARVISSASKSTSLQHRGEAALVLEGGQHGHSRFRTLFWFTLSACSLSSPPPVCESHIVKPASLAPSIASSLLEACGSAVATIAGLPTWQGAPARSSSCAADPPAACL